MYLRCAVSSTPKQWARWLPLAELWYNFAYHSSLKCCPFKALYGVEPSLGTVPETDASANSEVAETLQERKHFSDLLKEQLARAQNKMKVDADTKRSPRQLQVGEQVELKLQPYTQLFVVNRPCPKLALKYFRPYTILERIGEAAYKLELPSTAQVHPVFHISQLKQYTPDHTPVFAELPSVPQLDLAELELEYVLDHHLTKKGNTDVTQVLIKWSSLPDEFATWEDYYVIKNHYPAASA
jgi:hypothetical protein